WPKRKVSLIQSLRSCNAFKSITWIDDDCAPCDNLLSPPPPQQGPKLSIGVLFTVQIRKLVRLCPPTSEDSARKEGITLKKVRYSCNYFQHIHELLGTPGIPQRYRGETYGEFCRQTINLNCTGRVVRSTKANIVVEVDIVRELEILTLSKDAEDGRCAVCLEGLTFGSKIIRLPCLHIFHRDCIVQWLFKKQECPLCRIPLLGLDC
ncbi:uncharacterized protein LOC111289213, partial [Durio zibethinus]|uniref:Uncharacterized protein LOC111289213 n=1 Tax=Durio zibethinus TaxID=66656 RepID=A0A6P5Y5S9_DURZI